MPAKSKVKPIDSLSDLQPDAANANKHTQRGMSLMETSIRELGYGDSLTVDKNGVVISGNGRLEVLADIQMDNPIVVQTDGTRPVIHQRTDLDLTTDERAKRLAIFQNRVGEVNLEWDASILQELAESDVDLTDLFNEEEWANLLSEIPSSGIQPGVDPDSIPDNVETRCKTGDLWILGSHRLLCGDSTKAGDVARLMGGEKATLVFTDPPYEFETSGGNWGGKRPKVYDRVAAAGLDKFDPCDFLEILPSLFESGSCAAYVFCNKDLLLPYLAWARDAKISATVLVWKRQAVPFGDGHMPDVEYIIYIRRNGKWNDGTQANRSRVLEYTREARDDHPTAKPVELVTNQLLLTTGIGDIVADPFLGSGTTLIACEQLGRRCYGMEISERPSRLSRCCL